MKEKKKIKSIGNVEDNYNKSNYDRKLYDGCDESEHDEID